MGLIDLIRNLDGSIKTTLLGDKITEILRYTFVQNEYDAVDDDVVNEAVALQCGEDLVKRKRDLLIDSCRLKQLKLLGFENHNQAINLYTQDLDRFVSDFSIEEDYLLVPLKDERENFEVQIPKYGECNGIGAFPHDYQLRLKLVIVKKLFTELNPIILASMPTGAGKTVLAMEVIYDLFRSYGPIQEKSIKVIWAVNSKELAEQSLKSFQRGWNQKGDHSVVAERYFGKFNSILETDSSKITFATFDLLSARKSSQEVKKLMSEADFVFIDEAHSSEARTYSDIIQQYKSLNDNHRILGLTATPYRSDDNEFRSLKDIFTDYLKLSGEGYSELPSPLQYLIDGKFLSKVSFEILNIAEGEIGFSEYYRNLHESVLSECRSLIERGENTIIFAKSKAHAVALSIFLKKNAINNGLIVGETSDPKRKEYLSNFADKSNSLSVLVNHQILSTGIDVPGMNSIMILADIGSPTLALQILGRAMRGPKNGGNPENKIYLTPSNQNKLKQYKILESIVLT